MFTVVGTFSTSDMLYWLGWGCREGSGVHTWPKKPKMAFITEYLNICAVTKDFTDFQVEEKTDLFNKYFASATRVGKI